MSGKETKLYEGKSILKRGAIDPLRNLGRTPELIPAPLWPPRAFRCALMEKGVQRKDLKWGGKLLASRNFQLPNINMRPRRHNAVNSPETSPRATCPIAKLRTSPRGTIRSPGASPWRGRKAETEAFIEKRQKLFENIKNATSKVDSGIRPEKRRPVEQLWAACRSDNGLSEAKFIFKQYKKFDVNESDLKGFTAIMYACIRGDYQLVHLILRNRGDPEIANNDGFTPFQYTILNEKYNLARLLLKWSADIDSQDNTGCSSLYLAVGAEKIWAVNFLLENCARVDLPNFQKLTPLMKACQIGFEKGIDIVRVLIKRRADVRFHDVDGYTALMYASSAGQLLTVRLLLETDGENIINQRANDGTNALYLAASEGHADVVQALIEAGVEVDARRRSDKRTPLMQACERGHLGATEHILEAEAKTLWRDREGKNALQLAEDGNWRDLFPFIKRFMRAERLKLGLGDLKGVMAFRHGPLRGHPDAEALSKFIPAHRRIVRRQLTIKQKPFLHDHLKAWRALTLKHLIVQKMFERCQARSENKLRRRIRKRSKRFLQAWRSMVRHKKRVKKLFLTDPHKERRALLRGVKGLIFGLQKRWQLQFLIQRWKKFIIRIKVSRNFAGSLFLENETKRKLKMAYTCFRNWKFYHVQVGRAKIFFRISQYPNLRFGLWAWKVGTRIEKKESDMMFSCLAEWYSQTLKCKKHRARKKYFRQWKQSHTQLMTYHETKLSAHSRKVFGRRVQPFFWQWLWHHLYFIAAREIQKHVRGFLGRKKAEFCKSILQDKLRRLEEKRKWRERKAKKKRKKKAVLSLERVARRSGNRWAAELLMILQKDAKSSEKSIFAREDLACNKLHIAFQKLGIKCTRDHIFELLREEKLESLAVLSLEIFIAFMIQISKKRPGHLDSLRSSGAGGSEKSFKKRFRSESVKAVGYQSLKW